MEKRHNSQNNHQRQVSQYQQYCFQQYLPQNHYQKNPIHNNKDRKKHNQNQNHCNQKKISLQPLCINNQQPENQHKQINQYFGTQTNQSVPFQQSRLTFDSQEHKQSKQIINVINQQILTKFINYLEFHAIYPSDIWEQQLQININQFVKKIHEKIGYSFSNQQLIALMKIAAKNPIIQARDFTVNNLIPQWKQEAQIMKRKIKLNSKRRHQKNHYTVLNQQNNFKQGQNKNQYKSLNYSIIQNPLKISQSKITHSKFFKRPLSGQQHNLKKKDSNFNLNIHANTQISVIGDQSSFGLKNGMNSSKQNFLKNRNQSMKVFSSKNKIVRQSNQMSKVSKTTESNFLSYNNKNINSKQINQSIIEKQNKLLKYNLASSTHTKNQLSITDSKYDPLTSFKASRMSAILRQKQKEEDLQKDIKTNILQRKWDCIVKTGQINRWLQQKQDNHRFKINNTAEKIEIIQYNLQNGQQQIIPEVVFLKKYRAQAALNRKQKMSQSKKENNAPPASIKNSKTNLKGTVLMVLQDGDKLTKNNLHNRLQQRDQQLNFVLLQIMRTKSLFQQQNKILEQNLINKETSLF